MRALISVSDKTGLIELAKELSGLGVEIVSTGGTAKALKESKISSTEVSEITGFAEILEGRVKTLHPKIFGGILFIRDNAQHKADVERFEIPEIDWVIVNLYPFERIHLENRLSKMEMLEFIDIGGVSLLRAAGKNFKDIVILCDQADYKPVIDEFKENKQVSFETKKRLAAKAFAHTAHYDSMIARFFRELQTTDQKLTQPSTELLFPTEFTIGLRKVSDLRYGENPQQKAALYKESGVRDWGVVNAEKLQGKELSFNNFLDLDGAWQVVNSFNLNQQGGQGISDRGNFRGVCCAIIKHTNPCGVAIGKNAVESFQTALACDPLSAFGGIIGFSSTVDGEAAKEIAKSFFECVIAPEYTPEALEIFKKKVNLRILRQATHLSLPYEMDVKKVSGGLLIQQIDMPLEDGSNVGSSRKVVTQRAPTPEELYSMEFAWKICKFVKSNTIVLSRGTVTQGIGAGQMSRIDSLKAAIEKMNATARQESQESSKKGTGIKTTADLQWPLVMASDAFFPFRDCVDLAVKAGVSAIIQPGGSIRDQESIDAANEHRVAMIFTGIRHFRH